MLKKMIFITSLSVCLLCDTPGPNEECTPIDEPVEILYPKGGELLYVGDTVVVKWKAVKALAHPLSLSVLTDSGKTATYLVDSSTIIPEGEVACMEHIWVIGGNEVSSVNYASSAVQIQIGKYNYEHDYGATTRYFTVKQKGQ